MIILCSTTLFSDTAELYFQGNKHVNERELYSALGLYKPYFYEFYKDKPAVETKTVQLLMQTLKSYYKTKGFFHAVVTYTKNNNQIIFVINEEAPIVVADIAILSKFDITAKIELKEGEIFDTQKFTQSKKDIQSLYTDKGYCNTQLNAKAWVDIETNKSYLVYEVFPNEICYFGAVKIYPSKNIDSEIIKSLLYIEEGDFFSTTKITQSYESLYGYDGISKVIIDTAVENNNSVTTNITVTQNDKPIRFQTGIGVSSNEGAMLSFGVKHRNILGNLKTVGLSTRVTQIKQTIKTNYDMPLANRNSAGMELGFENEDFIGFKEKRYFGSIFLKQREIPHTFKESLVFDNSYTYDSEDNFLVPEVNLFILSPKLEWEYDTRDKILDPREGYFINSEIMGSLKSEISDASYYKFKISGGYILPLSSSVLAMKASAGALHLYDGDIPSSYRFYAGGMNSNRAYGYRKLGPKNDKGDPIGSDSIIEATVEYRFPIYGNFKGVVFNDNTFLKSDYMDGYDKGYHSAGFGLRYLTPIGPIAIDFGFDMSNPTSQYAFHFHVGELF
jgi:translocation and assembly module TamA